MSGHEAEQIAETATLASVMVIPTSEPDALIGTVLDDRYRVLRRLGQGGMGLVYEAEHRFLKTIVAIKLLRSEARNDEESLERLKREARAASAIGNKHIVDVRDFGLTPDGTVYVAMERIEGQDLLKEIRQAPLTWERARHVALQVCEALGAAHAQGIVHRDLKPENVLLTEKNGDPDFVKVVDFGIAKVEGGEKLTMAGRVMGTPEYMSPEQCAGRNVDARSDVYALGVMLYEMVTGKLPFNDPDMLAIVKMHMTQAPVPPSQVRPEAELPLAFEAVVLRCMAKSVRRRFASMADVATALRAIDGSPAVADDTAARAAWAEAEAPAPAVQARETPKVTVGESGRRRSPLVLGAVAFGLLAGLGGAAVLLLSPPASERVRPADPRASVAPSEPSSERSDQSPTTGATTAPEVSTPAVVAAPSPTIELISAPEGAEVYEDGALLGHTPLQLGRPERGGRLALEVRATGFLAHSLVLSALSATTIHVTLAPAPVARPASEARASSEDHEGGSAPPATDPTPPVRERAPAATESVTRHREFRDPWGD